MFRNLLSFYSWSYPALLTKMLASHQYHIGAYLKEYWQTDAWSNLPPQVVQSRGHKMLTLCVRLGILMQLLLGFWLVAEWYWHDLTAGLAFGLALIISYPVVWAHLLVIMAWLRLLTRPKVLGKAIVGGILESQVRQLRKRHDFTVVAVVGSIGKTSTKAAIARTLQAGMRVQWQEGNYNDRVTVPLVFFNHTLPGLFNVPAWVRIWASNRKAMREEYPYDIVVIELGTDNPGQIKQFAYTQPDIAVVTAITPEHMEYFGTLDAVAAEELAIFDFARTVLVNIDDTPKRYLKQRNYQSYGTDKAAFYRVADRKSMGLEGQQLTFALGKNQKFSVTVPMLGEQGCRVTLAAAAVAAELAVPVSRIEQGLRTIEPFAGRMRLLSGIKKSTLIDDTYNATPIAAIAALNVLYEVKSPQRVAILGSMNELGAYSPEAHTEVGNHCDPEKLELVVTIGDDANTYLAEAAEKRGCIVERTRSPYEAGKIVEKCIKQHAVVLAKGSQNGVFAEEAIKILLKNQEDSHLLVRQSSDWLAKKHQQFPLG